MGPLCSEWVGWSSTDFKNSGWYFRADLLLILGETTGCGFFWDSFILANFLLSDSKAACLITGFGLDISIGLEGCFTGAGAGAAGTGLLAGAGLAAGFAGAAFAGGTTLEAPDFAAGLDTTAFFTAGDFAAGTAAFLAAGCGFLDTGLAAALAAGF
jgi:hypothetical protein